jgi:hypothetical protein
MAKRYVSYTYSIGLSANYVCLSWKEYTKESQKKLEKFVLRKQDLGKSGTHRTVLWCAGQSGGRTNEVLGPQEF